MNLSDKHQALQQFKQTEVYRDLRELGLEYYNGFFMEAMKQELDSSQRVANLEKMRAINMGLELIDALLERYEQDLKNQKEREEAENE